MKNLFTIGISILTLTFTALAASPVAPLGDDAGNYAYVQAANSYILADAAANGTTKYVEVNIPLILSGTNDPVLRGFGTNGAMVTYAFTDAASLIGYGKLTLPNGWVEGSPITPQIHWAQAGDTSAGNTTNIVFQMGYLWIPAAGAGTVEVAENVTNNLPGVSWGAATATFTGITNAAAKIGDTVLFRYLRVGASASDTHTNIVPLLGFGVSLQVNKLGSTTATTK